MFLQMPLQADKRMTTVNQLLPTMLPAQIDQDLEAINSVDHVDLKIADLCSAHREP